jgi:hypothetical protein
MYGKSYRILAAVHPDTMERISRILEGHHLVIVQTMKAAEAALDAERVELIFVGARFDESRMFDFLDYLRGHAEHHKVPIAAAVVIPMKMTPEALKGMAHAVKIYGASLFVNLNDFPDDAVSNTRVRVILETLCAPAEAVIKAASSSEPGGTNPGTSN